MLRNDTIYMLNKHYDSKVPTTETIKNQAKKIRNISNINVRLYLGKVIGTEEKRLSLRK